MTGSTTFMAIPSPHYGRNDFGGTLGGPIFIPRIYDGRTSEHFSSALMRGLRLTQPQAAQVQYVPDMAIRSEASPGLRAALNAFPLPTTGGIDYGFLAQFIQPYSIPSSLDSRKRPH